MRLCQWKTAPLDYARSQILNSKQAMWHHITGRVRSIILVEPLEATPQVRIYSRYATEVLP